MSDPAAPVEIGSIQRLDTAERVAVDGGIVYVLFARRDLIGGPGGDYFLHALDVTDPATPVELAAVDVHAPDWCSPDWGSDPSLTVGDGFAYVAGNGGIAWLDVRDPANPEELGACGLYHYSSRTALAGDHVVVANLNGLTVLTDAMGTLFRDGFECGTTDPWSSAVP